MPYTNYPNGLTSFGVPLVGGVGGIPLTGKWWFCNYATGSDGNADSGSDGAPPDAPLQTISRAHDLAVAGRNDVVVIMGDGSTTATQRISSSLTWSKNATHLIGMTAPTKNAQRARIAPLTSATVNLAPLMTISAAGCIFGNYSYFQGIGQSATDEKLLDVTGDRNYFGNVEFGGMGAAAGAARAGSYIINLNGGDENTFEGCTVGLETTQRSAANASVKVGAAFGQRNQFLDCNFMMAASATSPLFLDLSTASCLNGSSMTFRRCLFQNLTGISGASNPAVVASLNASINGVVVMDQCTTNATKWAAATTQMIISGYAIGNGFSSGRFATAADS